MRLRPFQTALALTALFFLGMLGFRALSGEAVRNDFHTIYTAAWIMVHDDPAKLYDLELQTRTQEALFHRPGVLPFLHPPFEAVLFAPIAWIPYLAAYFLWGIVNSALWFWFVSRMRAFVSVPEDDLGYLLACFGFLPVLFALLQGGTTLLVLMMYLLAFAELKRGREATAGIFLGLALFRFQLVLPFVLICALRRKWKLIGGFAATAFVLGLVSLVGIGLQGMLSYVNLMTGITARSADPVQSSIPYGAMTTLRGFLTIVLTGGATTPLTSAAIAVTSIALLGCVAWRWRQDDLDLSFAAAVVVAIVTGFYSLVHDLSLALPAMLLVMGSPQFQKKSVWALVLRISMALMYGVPTLFILRNWVNDLYWVCPILLLLLAGVLGIQSAESTRTSHKQTC